jgi:methyl-accepting chemotaxis protein
MSVHLSEHVKPSQDEMNLANDTKRTFSQKLPTAVWEALSNGPRQGDLHRGEQGRLQNSERSFSELNDRERVHAEFVDQVRNLTQRIQGSVDHLNRSTMEIAEKIKRREGGLEKVHQALGEQVAALSDFNNALKGDE